MPLDIHYSAQYSHIHHKSHILLEYDLSKYEYATVNVGNIYSIVKLFYVHKYCSHLLQLWWMHQFILLSGFLHIDAFVIGHRLFVLCDLIISRRLESIPSLFLVLYTKSWYNV